MGLDLADVNAKGAVGFSNTLIVKLRPYNLF